MSTDEHRLDKRSITAWLLGCEESDLVAFRDYGDRVATLNQAGQKFTFSNKQLESGEAAMGLALTIDEVIQAGKTEDVAKLIKPPPVRKKPAAKPKK